MRNRLDIYHDGTERSGRPVLLYVHGGGWSPVSNKNHQGKPLMLHLAARGWLCVSANYRVSPRVAFPDHLIDVKRALAWVRAHAHAFGGDPSFVAVAGGSAGGHLAALLALTENDPEYQPGFEDANTSIQACIPLYGVYDFVPDQTLKMAERRLWFIERYVMQKKHAEHRAEFEKASPYWRVRDDAPPFFVIHGSNDTLVPVAEARAFVARLREVTRKPVVYAELSRTQHAFDVFHSIRTAYVVRAVERFCDYVLATRAETEARR
jgi:acetyl esterase/lipase